MKTRICFLHWSYNTIRLVHTLVILNIWSAWIKKSLLFGTMKLSHSNSYCDIHEYHQYQQYITGNRETLFTAQHFKIMKLYIRTYETIYRILNINRGMCIQ